MYQCFTGHKSNRLGSKNDNFPRHSLLLGDLSRIANDYPKEEHRSSLSRRYIDPALPAVSCLSIITHSQHRPKDSELVASRRFSASSQRHSLSQQQLSSPQRLHITPYRAHQQWSIAIATASAKESAGPAPGTATAAGSSSALSSLL